jgi:hypothetical protein
VSRTLAASQDSLVCPACWTSQLPLRHLDAFRKITMNHEGFLALDRRNIFPGELKVSSRDLVPLVPLGGTPKNFSTFNEKPLISIHRCRPRMPSAASYHVSMTQKNRNARQRTLALELTPTPFPIGDRRSKVSLVGRCVMAVAWAEMRASDDAPEHTEPGDGLSARDDWVRHDRNFFARF